MLFCPKCQQLEPTSAQRRDDGSVTHLCKKCGSAIPLRRDLKPGEVVAGFEIEEELGRGAMGIVYQARQTNLDREVAIKILSDDSASDEVYVERFFREARAAASLSHPNVVQAYDAGVTDDGIYYFVMEKVTGENLDLVLNNLGPLNVMQALDIFLSVANALSYAWTRNQLSHGDIKPENIIMRLNGKVKLADFGLARRAKDADLADEDIRATPAYAPPEIIRGDKDVPGFKSDMYSFGATAYHVLAGHEPFVGTDPAKVCAMQLTDVQVPLSKLNPNIPQRLSDLVDELMEKEPEDRPASWTDVVAELKEIRRTLSSDASESPSAKPAAQARKKDWKRSFSRMLPIRKSFSPSQIVAAAAVLLAFAAILVLSLRSCGSKEEAYEDSDPHGKTLPSASAPNANDVSGREETVPRKSGGRANPVPLTEEQKQSRALELRNRLLDEAAGFSQEKAADLSPSQLDELYRSAETRFDELIELDKSLADPIFLPSQRETVRKYLDGIAAIQLSKSLGETGTPAYVAPGGPSNPQGNDPGVFDEEERKQNRALELRNGLLDEAADFSPEKAAALSPAQLDKLYRSAETRFDELIELDNSLTEPVFLPSQRETVRKYLKKIADVPKSNSPRGVRTSAANGDYVALMNILPGAVESDSVRAEALRLTNILLADQSFTDEARRKNCSAVRRFLVLNQQPILPYLIADRDVLRNTTLFPHAYPDSVLDDIDNEKKTVYLSVLGKKARVGVPWSKLRSEEGEDQLIVTLVNSAQFPRLSEDFREYLFVRAFFLGVDPQSLKRRFDRASGLSAKKRSELNTTAGLFL